MKFLKEKRAFTLAEGATHVDRQLDFRKNAFTLAEVLITLGIIGVVAALTIPSLIQKTQNQEYVTALKKAYSETNQALKLMANDYGCPGDLKSTGLFDTTSTNATLGDALIKYFKVVKKCGITPNNNCFSKIAYVYYDGSHISSNYYNLDSDGYYSFVTADGTTIGLANFSNNCSNNWSNSGTGVMSNVCAVVRIDVNGLKKPNAFGRDIFFFWITNDQLYPYGASDDKNHGTNNWWQAQTPQPCSANYADGWTCAGRIVEQGWQMNY